MILRQAGMSSALYTQRQNPLVLPRIPALQSQDTANTRTTKSLQTGLTIGIITILGSITTKLMGAAVSFQDDQNRMNSTERNIRQDFESGTRQRKNPPSPSKVYGGRAYTQEAYKQRAVIPPLQRQRNRMIPSIVYTSAEDHVDPTVPVRGQVTGPSPRHIDYSHDFRHHQKPNHYPSARTDPQ